MQRRERGKNQRDPRRLLLLRLDRTSLFLYDDALELAHCKRRSV